MAVVQIFDLVEHFFTIDTDSPITLMFALTEFVEMHIMSLMHLTLPACHGP